MLVRGVDKVKRELGFVLIALNVRKIVAQRTTLFDKKRKRQFLHYFNRNYRFLFSQRHLCPEPFQSFQFY